MSSRSLLILLLAGLAGARAATTIDVSDTPRIASLKRLGINLGWLNNYDSGQIMKELLFRNPGFEGQINQSIVRVGTTQGTATAFVDENPFAQWPTGFWNGATYEVIRGAALGRAGSVVSSTAPSGGLGTSYTVAENGTVFGAGDYLILRKSATGGATSGWSTNVSGGGAISTEVADLPPGTLGRQCVRLSATGAGQNATLMGNFESSVAGQFIQVNGGFQLRFKARGAGGANRLSVQLSRGSPANLAYLSQSVVLSTSWQDYTLSFNATEDGSARGTVQALFSPANQSEVLLDDVSLAQSTGGDATNTTRFRDAVVAALRELRPGVLRSYVEVLGDSLDNQLAQPFGRQRAAYSSQLYTRDSISYGPHEFLELCELIGAEPWYVMPSVLSTQEMSNLVEYLAGPETSPYGARRAALGHPAPWTDVFTRIHLEFGNEAWNNATYYGGTISDAPSYGARGSAIFGVAKASPYYAAAKFDLVLGGQADVPARNIAIHNASTNHDTLAVAPYIGGNTTSYATDEELYGPLFAETEQVDQAGYMRQNYLNQQGSSRPVPLALYEVNLHTTNASSIPQERLNAFTPSLGAGLAVADHMLMMLRDLGVQNQLLYGLTQYANNRSDGKYVLLWGAVRDMGVTNRRRPQFLAVQLANEALAGRLVTTAHSGDNPVWDQPLTNGVQASGLHELRSYASASGTMRSLIVFNLSRTQARAVNFTGVNAPHGTVTLRRLGGSALTSTNENDQSVAISQQSLFSFDPVSGVSLPAYSMSLLQWTLPPVEQWRIEHFGKFNATGDAADMADPDGDGITNLGEYGLGSDPKQSTTASPGATLGLVQQSGLTYMTLTFTRPLTASDLTYTVQISNDLAGWQDGSRYGPSGNQPTTSYTIELSRTTVGGQETISIRDALPMGTGGSPRFMRLKMELP
jgi:hypothetical protein